MIKHLLILISAYFVVAKRDNKKHFSKKVDVEIVQNEETTVVIGNLEIRLRQRNDLIESSVTKDISEEIMRHLTGTLYVGVIRQRRDCTAWMFIKESTLISGNIDCKRKHFVIEQLEHQYVMHKKPQRPQKLKSAKKVCEHQDQRFCTLFIHTDPYFWKHMRAKHSNPETTRESIMRMMVGHVLAANELYAKYKFTGENCTHSAIQFVLAGFQIDDDSKCDEVMDYKTDEVDYNYDYEDYPIYDLGSGDYSYDEENSGDDDEDDVNVTDVPSIFDLLSSIDSNNNSVFSADLSDSRFDYDYEYDYEYDEDSNWNYKDAYKEDDAVILNGENCYEDINGTVDISKEFCKPFALHESTLFLNMFSTVDHSRYCLAHIWTYRDLEVVGLADNPTEGAIGLSGFCAEYDTECQIGFNTGLVSFRHLGNQLSLADSQETFMHELAHSFGAAHDPREDQHCAPGGTNGNYLMYPGPLGNSFIRREFSPCSKFEIGKVLDETKYACLLTRNELDTGRPIQESPKNSTEATKDEECQSEQVNKKLDTIKTYLIDLKHYTEDKKKRKVLFRLNRKFKQLIGSRSQRMIIDKRLKVSLKMFFSDVNSSLKDLDDELEVFLVRKISNVSKSIVKCLK